MISLPVFKIIGRAVWFEVANLFTLFRLTWLPLVLLIVTQWAIAYAQVNVSAAMPGARLDELSAYSIATWCSLLVEGLALSIVAVQVHRVILFNDRRPGVYFAFPFGRTELLYVTMCGLTFSFAIAFDVAARAAFAELPYAIQHSVIFDYASVCALVLGIKVVLRLSLWPPAVVANKSLSLGEAWRLTRGNGWAFFALYFFAWMLPVFIGTFVFHQVNRLPEGIPTAASFFPTVGLQEKLMLLRQNHAFFPSVNVLLIDFAQTFLVTTYTVAVLSYAYKAVRGFEADHIDQQASPVSEESLPGMKPLGAL